MASPTIPDLLFRPPASPATRILFLARHPPLEPAWVCPSFPGDGGYPAYYQRVCSVLTGLGYSLETANTPLALTAAAARTDLVFSLYNRMEGVRNPEVIASSLCEFLHLPYIGARPNTRALAEDKWYARLAARSLGLPVADGAIYGSEEDLARPPAFPGPYFVKNRFGAASEGVSTDSIQDDWAGARQVARRLLERGMSVLVEAWIPGIDITVPVLGGERPIVLGIVRPGTDKAGGIITEDLKRDDPLGYQMFSASPQVEVALRNDAAALWDGVGPMDYYRLDYRLDPDTGRRTFLEFNICCHIGRSGAICLAAAQWGLTQADVLGHVVEYSLWRQGKRAARPAQRNS